MCLIKALLHCVTSYFIHQLNKTKYNLFYMICFIVYVCMLYRVIPHCSLFRKVVPVTGHHGPSLTVLMDVGYVCFAMLCMKMFVNFCTFYLLV